MLRRTQWGCNISDKWPIEVFNSDGKRVAEYPSIAFAARKLFMNPSSIHSYIFYKTKSGIRNPRKSKITGKEYHFKLKQV